MSDTAQKFANVAAEVGPLLDALKQDPAKAHDTFFTLDKLAHELPEGSHSREVIEGQMIHILARDFPVTADRINDSLTLMAEFGQKFSDNQELQTHIDAQSARMLTIKLDSVNQTLDSEQPAVETDASLTSTTSSSSGTADWKKPDRVKTSFDVPTTDAPEPFTPEVKVEDVPKVDEAAEDDKAAAEIEAHVEEAPVEEKQPEPVVEAPAPKPEPAPVAVDASDALQDAISESAQKLQVALDQLPVATRKAMPEFQPVMAQGGTVKAFAATLEQEMAKSTPSNPSFVGLSGDDKKTERKERVKKELDSLTQTAEALDKVPGEADQLQSLYDQVDDKHKNEKGVFGYFHDKYGGNARRFAVERTAQYSKYVSASEANSRMMEDLNKLIEQCQKELKGSQKSGQGKSGNDSATNGRSFFQG